jgi:hypothetical protein
MHLFESNIIYVSNLLHFVEWELALHRLLRYLDGLFFRPAINKLAIEIEHVDDN